MARMTKSCDEVYYESADWPLDSGWVAFRTYEDKPMVFVSGRGGLELRPKQARKLAGELHRLADRAEGKP